MPLCYYNSSIEAFYKCLTNTRNISYNYVIASEGDYMDKEYTLFSLTKYNSNIEPDKKMPENVKLKKNQMWCPYCSCPVIFVKDKRLGIKKCPICGISDRDYNVKIVNKIWK